MSFEELMKMGVCSSILTPEKEIFLDHRGEVIYELPISEYTSRDESRVAPRQ